MVATLIAYVGTALAVSPAVATFIVNFALSQIVTRMFADNPETQQDMGVRQQIPPSGVNALPIAYGDVFMGGTFVDAVLSNDQQTMFDVLAISSISPNGQFTYDCSQMYYGDRLITFAASGSVIGSTIFNGGTGYTVGDVLTVAGGSPTTSPQLTVTNVASGVVTGVSISTAGSYTYGTNPNNCAGVTGGSGTGATFILRYSAYGPTVVALTDDSGNIDTKVASASRLQVHLYTSNQAGTIGRYNTSSYPWELMGPTEPSGIPTELQWISGAYDGVNPSRRMNGTAFAIVRIAYNQDAGTTSLFPITFHVSHYLNGTGAAKAGDVWFDYITNANYGGAVDAAFVNSTSATALNTYGDEVITFTNSKGISSTQARYRINGVLDAGQSVLSNIDRIVSACDSWMTYNAALGQWSVVINKAESTSYAFNDNNIIGDIRVSATDITSSINQVEARFPFKENRDQASFVNIETPVGLLYPNEPVNKYSITYDMVNDSVQATYLANRLLEQAREDLIVGFNTTYYGIQVDAGNVVSVTNADYGWNAKLFRVMKVNEASLPDGGLGARLELTEYNAAVYDNASITQFSPVPNSNLPSVNYFSPLSAPTVTSSNPSSAIPNFNVQISIPAVGRVTIGELYYTSSATPTATDWFLLTTAGRIDGEPVAPSTTYTFKNQVLPTGASTTATYYFAYLVGNDLARSVKSPTSAAFTWSPTASVGPFVDISGFTGFTKNSAGTAITPSSSVLTAIYQNVTSPTFSWSISGATPTTGTSSTITITPSLGASSVTAALTVSGTNLASPIVRTITMPITLDGSGSAGLNSATVYLYNKNTTTTAPASFNGTFTYTFTSGVLSGGTLNGWSQTPPAIAAGEFLFLSLATASSTASTDSIPTSEFSTPQVISGTGTNGANTAIVSLFQSNTSAVTPPASPTGTFTYTFATAALSGGTLNGWAQSAPTLTAGQYLWQKQATAYANTATDSVAASEFSGAVVVGGVGDAGLGGISAQTGYKVQSQSTAAPTFTTPTSGSALPSNWYSTLALALSALSPPQSVVAVGQIIWYIQGQYNSNGVTVNGVGANTTAWTGPIAASVFQDIRSDNWNGSNPPSASPVSSWGTTGYYISQADGNMYANGFYARGKMLIDGSNGDLLNTSLKANLNGTADVGVLGYGGGTTAGRGLAGIASGTSGAGAVGSATTAATRAGVLALASGGAAYAFEGSGGAWKTDNSTLVTNLNAQYLNGVASSGFYATGSALGTPSSGNLANCTFPTLNQNTTGNAATATNVPYSGLTGTVPTWNQNTTGNAATATNVPYSGLTGTVPTWNQNTTGNAATATNVPYSGLTGTVPTWNQNTTGNAATATSALTATTAVNANVAGNSAQLGGYSAGNASGNVPISNGTVNTNLNADLLDGQNASAFVNIASGTVNGKYLYYVNNTGAPSNPVTRAAWILLSTNDGGIVYVAGYI